VKFFFLRPSGSGKYNKQRFQGKFFQPCGIAVDDNGLIYVVEWGKPRIQIFSPQGEFLNSFEDSRLTTATHIAIEGDKHIVSVYNPQSLEVYVAGKWERSVPISKGKPVGVAIDGEGKVIVGVQQFGVQIFSKDFKLLKEIEIKDPGHIMTMAIDRFGRILVPSSDRAHVYVYGEKS